MPVDRKSLTPHERLRDGVQKFQSEVFSQNKERYAALAGQPQRPHSLVITCADSRVDPEAMTHSGPGEIFVTRNIGNLVPPYGEMLGGVSAVIEYAVMALNVEQIVICGHSDCGAMKGLMNREAVAAMPTVNRWLQNADAALSIMKAKNPDAETGNFLSSLIKENVLLQLNHLRTHPSVAGRVAQGNLKLLGWVYDIFEGTVLEFDAATEDFKPLV